MSSERDHTSNSVLSGRTEPAAEQVAVILPAGGRGDRVGPGRKQFRTLGERSVLELTIRVFEQHPLVHHIFVAVPQDQVLILRESLQKCGLSKMCNVTAGGETRQASVAAALDIVPDTVRFVLVHDAVRPFLSSIELDAIIEAVMKFSAASLAIPVADTLRRREGDTFGDTVPRKNLWRMQTPQAFTTDLLRRAHAASTQGSATDDVELVQALGFPVHVVEGKESNFKITTPGDWEMAQLLTGEHPDRSIS